ncbi:MAG: ACP S-malonyltransferase [Halothiobacillaceae bacterium]
MSFACVFPGQGSQSVGMMSDWAESDPVVASTFAEAAEVLGDELLSLMRSGPGEILDRTENTQPAMLTVGVAAWRAYRAAGGPMPAAMAGHSLGEYTALVAAGAISFADALKLVRRRGVLMQQAVPAGEGAMAAVIGLDDATVEGVCETCSRDQVCEAVNYNAPGQVVVAGTADAIRLAVSVAESSGARKVVLLPVSVPAHSTLMKPAASKLAEALGEIEIVPPTVPVVHNVDAAARQDPEAIREALAAQLWRPVRWVDCVRALQELGAGTLLEMGPGKVLSGLTRRIDRALTAVPVLDAAGLEKALALVASDD